MCHLNSGSKSEWNKHQQIILLLCLLACASSDLWSQSAETGSNAYFPRFVITQSTDSQIMIFNPGITDASVTLSINGTDGSPLGTSVKITVPALGQVVRTGQQLFGIQADASLRVSSSTPGLICYYQTLDSKGNFVDGAGAPEEATSLIFPVMPGTAPEKAEIVLQNRNVRNALIQARLWKLDGTLMGESRVLLGSQSHYRGTLRSLFSSVSDFSAASHVTTESRAARLMTEPQPVLGTSIVTGFPSPSSTLDVAGINAITLTEASNAGGFSHFRIGLQHFSYLSIANVEPAAVDVTVNVVASNGTTLGTKKITLPANGGLRQPLESLFPSLVSVEKEGWLFLQAQGRLGAALIHGIRDLGSLAVIPLQRTPQLGFAFPQVVLGSGLYTELSLANPGPNPAYADIYIVSPDGSTLASTQIVLPAAKGISQRLEQILPELTAVSGGVLFIRSTEPLFANSTIWAENGRTASSFVAQPAPSYVPGPLKVFAVTGKVTLNERPAKDFNVLLTGASAVTKTVRDDGVYVFSDLPAGKYSLAVEEPGFQFVPSQVSFELRTASKRQNFESIIPSNSIVIRNASVKVGSADTTFTVYGSDFNTTSQAYVGVVRLHTTYVDPWTLQVLVPAYQLTEPARLDIFIATNESSSNRRVTSRYPVWVYQDKPVLTSVQTNGFMLEGRGEATVTLQGAGFLPGATVTVNGSSTGILILSFSDNKIVASVPAQYFQRAGEYPVTVVNHNPVQAESNLQVLTVYRFDSITFTNPSAIKVGSADTPIEIYGRDFNKTSQAYIGTVRLESSPVDSGLVQAVIPAYMLTEAVELRLQVITNPGPNQEVSNAYLIYVYRESLTLTGVETNGYLLEGRGGTTIILHGSGFLPGAKVLINRSSTGIGIRSLDETTIVADVPAPFFKKAGVYPVVVVNPYPKNLESNTLLLTVYSFDPDTFTRPSAVEVKSGDTTIEIYGKDFGPTSRAYVDLVRLETTYVDSGLVKALIPAYMFDAPTEIRLKVVTDESGPNQRESRVYSIYVYQKTLTLTGIETDGNLLEGRAAAILILKGSGFLPKAQVRINGLSDGIEILSLDGSRIEAKVPAAYFATGGIYPVVVANPYPENAESNIFLMSVYFPIPAVESIYPAAMSARIEEGAQPLDLTLYGYGFRRGAVVLMDDKPMPTIYCELNAACLAEHINAVIDPRLLRVGGFKKISVRNPDPSLDPSQVVFLRVENLQPTITSVIPGTAKLVNVQKLNNSYSMPIVVNGTNFAPGTDSIPGTQVRLTRVTTPPGVPGEFVIPDAIISSTQLYFTIPVSYPGSIGDWTVEAKNPQPGGGLSKPVVFSITERTFDPNPFLIFLTPETVPAGGGSFTLTVTGQGFEQNALINFSSIPLATTYVSEKELTAVVPATMIRTAGKKAVTVTNPNNGGTSNKLFVEVQ